MSTSTFVRRAVAAVAGGAVVAGGLLAVAPAPVAHAATPAGPEATAAITWLESQVDAGLLDGKVSVTMDYGLSLVAIGENTDERIDPIVAGVDGGLQSFIDDSFSPEASTAKAAYFYEEVGATPPGGADLVQETADALDAEGRLDGGIVFNQVWAVLALKAAENAAADDAEGALLDSQCDSGAWGFSCDGGLDYDYTAYSILALLPFADTDPAAATAVDDAVAWLKAAQGSDGAFGVSQYTPDNANSTGVVAWALGAVQETAAAAKAATWLADHQVVPAPACGASPLDGEAGAIAWSDASLRSGLTDGIATTARSEWILASAQALAALPLTPARPVAPATITGPSDFVHAGQNVTVTVKGLRTGQVACVSGIGAVRRLVGAGTLTLAVPAGTANHAVTLSFPGGSTSTTVKALDATALKVKVAAKVKAKKKAVVKVKGLAAGESVSVKIGKKTVTGTANANGVAKVKVKVTKKGKAKVKAVGQFPDRKGKATTRVS